MIFVGFFVFFVVSLLRDGNDEPVLDRNRQQDVALPELDHPRRQLSRREFPGAAAIAQLSNLEPIQIVNLLAQQRRRGIGLRRQAVPRQLLENLWPQFLHRNK